MNSNYLSDAHDSLSVGGGTFGVVMESTTLASPNVKIQYFFFTVPNANQTEL
jgi:hypothetical protein